MRTDEARAIFDLAQKRDNIMYYQDKLDRLRQEFRQECFKQRRNIAGTVVDDLLASVGEGEATR